MAEKVKLRRINKNKNENLKIQMVITRLIDNEYEIIVFYLTII